MKRPASDRIRGLLYLLGAALAWSTGGLLIKLIDLDGLSLAGARSWFALIPLLIYMKVAGKHHPPPPARFTPPIVLGSIAYAGTVLFFVIATKETTAANAILLQYTAPIWVALMSPLLLREAIRPIDRVAAVVVVIGLALFTLDDVPTSARLGDLFALISGLFFAGCIMALRHGRAGSGLRMVLYGNVLAGLVGLPFLISAAPPALDFLPIALLGIGQLGLGYILFMAGIRHVSALEGALVPVLEPLLNPLWVVIGVGERPSIYSIAGGVIVIGAISWRAWRGTVERRALIR